MESSRLEAFSDGVLAIIITIMVIEMKAPEETTLEVLIPMMPKFISYLVSFVFIGTYWNNHHHLFQATEQVNGKVLWANLHLLFWLSLIPFSTSWIGENHVEAIPVAFYGFILLMSALAFNILVSKIVANHAKSFSLRTIKTKNKMKGIGSMILYFLGIILSFGIPWAGIVIYIGVLAIWFIPDRKIEHVLNN